jgi:hypothetical protein
MGDRVLRLDAGHMTAIGAPDKVLGQTSEASRA